jgi:nucleoid-associated protein YgaU
MIFGERLDQIAYRYYGDPRYWRLLALANAIDDPLHISPGRLLRIPAVTVGKAP